MYLTWKHWIQKQRIIARLEKHGFQVLEIYVGHDIGDPVNNYHHTHGLIYVEWDVQHGGSSKQVRYNSVGFMDFLPPWLDCEMELDEKGKPKYPIRICANEVVTPIWIGIVCKRM